MPTKERGALERETEILRVVSEWAVIDKRAGGHVELSMRLAAHGERLRDEALEEAIQVAIEWEETWGASTSAAALVANLRALKGGGK